MFHGGADEIAVQQVVVVGKIGCARAGGVSFSEESKTANWKLLRFICNAGYTLMPKEKGVKRERFCLDSVSAEMSIPKKVTSENIILYCHGGGFVPGSTKACRAYCSMLAKCSGCRVVTIDYALAPEKPYPYGLNDCYTAYAALRKRFPNAKFCVQGESAGGNLTLAVTIRAINEDFPAPECIIPHSPVCDMSESLDRSYYDLHDATVNPDHFGMVMQSLYSRENDSKNPEISPIYFDRFSEFPPTFITVDDRETLRADADALYEKLDKAGVPVTMVRMKNAFHAFAPIGTSAPETMALLIDNVRFMKSVWGEEAY